VSYKAISEGSSVHDLRMCLMWAAPCLWAEPAARRPSAVLLGVPDQVGYLSDSLNLHMNGLRPLPPALALGGKPTATHARGGLPGRARVQRTGRRSKHARVSPP